MRIRSFGLVYALSVITHLPEELQHAWVRECYRVLRPGGYLLFSTLGAYYLSLQRLTHAEGQRFESGNLVVLYKESAGTSLCSAYHPESYVRDTLAGDFDVVRPVQPPRTAGTTSISCGNRPRPE